MQGSEAFLIRPASKGQGSRVWKALHSWASSWRPSANAPSNRLESLSGAQSRVPPGPVRGQHRAGSPACWSLATDLQPELKIKPGAPKNVLFIKTKSMCTALLEPQCQCNSLENMSSMLPDVPCP